MYSTCTQVIGCTAITHPNVLDFAGVLEFHHRPHSLLDWCDLIQMMDIVKVHIQQSQATKRPPNALTTIFWRQVHCVRGGVLMAFMPNLVARKMFFRLSGLAANHFSSKSSELPYLSAFELRLVTCAPKSRKAFGAYQCPKIVLLSCTPCQGRQIYPHRREMSRTFH